MQNSRDISVDSEASGVVNDAFAGVDTTFNAITLLHESPRHVVLRAKRFGRRWVLKGLTPSTDTEANRALLRKEFDIMMMLPSEGFPQAVSLEEVPGYGMCIVMEYIEGLTLGEWLKTRPPMEQRRRVALALIDIVGRMHQSGIVSRDIKPANVIVSRLSQMPMIIDFDLADTDTHTAFKSPGGTAGYISPEQATDFTPDCRNDIYSLAKLLLKTKPPRVWRPVLSRCLLRIDDRIPDAATLRRRLLRSEQILKWVVITAIAALAGLILLLGKNNSKPEHPDGMMQSAPALAAGVIHDTIRISENSDSLNRRIALLSDSLDGLTRGRRQHQIEVEELTEKSRQQLHALWQSTAMRYLDTVSVATLGFTTGYGFDPMSDMINRMCEENRHKFTDAELAGYRLALSEEFTKCVAEWNQKRKAKISHASKSQ